MRSPSDYLRRAAFVLACAAPRGVEACATCFGATDSKMAEGMNMGILVLLGVVGVVLGGIVTGFVCIAARTARVPADSLPSDPSPTPKS